MNGAGYDAEASADARNRVTEFLAAHGVSKLPQR
jgi:dienelactone hydrolase